LEASFPNPDVVNGYKVPYIQTELDKFEWTCPDLDALRQYAAEKFGWNMNTTDSKLLPVVQRYTKTLDTVQTDPTQARITTYFMKTAANQPVFNKTPSKQTKKDVTNNKKRKR